MPLQSGGVCIAEFWNKRLRRCAGSDAHSHRGYRVVDFKNSRRRLRQYASNYEGAPPAQFVPHCTYVFLYHTVIYYIIKLIAKLFR